jgi:peptidoglycan-associated lipoprotein
MFFGCATHFHPSKEKTVMKTVNIILVLCCLTLLAGCAKKPKADTAAAPPPSAAAAPVNSAVPTEAIVEEAITSPAGNAKGTATEMIPSLAGDRLETIYFDFDSFILSGDARAKLERNARRLQAASAGRITIEGHTDERGSDAYNLALGEKRARAAMAYLHHLGVAGEQMTVISYGEERPAESGQDEEAWSKNRRAEFM